MDLIITNETLSKVRIPANKRIFTSEEEQYLRENFNKVTFGEIAEKLSLHRKTVCRIVKRMGLKRTPEDLEYLYKNTALRKTRVLTIEEEQYLRENYKKVHKKELAEKLKVNKCTILVMLNKMGLKRTAEDIKFLNSQRSSPKAGWSIKLQKIEGGTRHNKKAAWHLMKWQKINGPISKKQILFYNTAGLFESLKLIRKSSFNKFVHLRNESIEKKERKEKRHALSLQKKENLKNEIAKRKLERLQKASERAEQKKIQSDKNKAEAKDVRRNEKLAAIEKERKEKAKAKKEKARLRELAWCEAKLKEDVPLIDTTYHTFEEHLVKDKNEGKVPVRLNHKTIVFVSRDKCVKDEAGNWVKK